MHIRNKTDTIISHFLEFFFLFSFYCPIMSYRSSSSPPSSSSSSSNSSSEQIEPLHHQEEVDYEPGYRPRKRYSPEELQLLQESFSNNPRAPASEVRRLADLCHTTERTIQIWFQNKRAQINRQHRIEWQQQQQRYQLHRVRGGRGQGRRGRRRRGRKRS